MRELATLVGRHLREAVRGRRGVRTLVVLLLAAFLPAFALATSGASAVWAAEGLLGLVLLALGAASGERLPRDRRTGRAAWLATLAPSAVLHRLAPAVAGMVLALAAGLLGALLVALALGGRAPELRHTRDVPGLVDRAVFADDLVLDVDGGPAPAVLELDLRRRDGLTLPLAFAWSVPGGPDVERRAAPGPVRLEVPAGTDAVALRDRTPDTALVLAAARWIEGPAPLLPSLLVVGLVLGLVAAALVPVAVLVSRFTSAPTAIAAGLLVGGLALARPLLVGLVPPGAPAVQALALRVLEGFAHLAPDVRTAALVGEVPAGRALAPGDVVGSASFLPLLAYAAVVLVLLALPAPPRVEPEARP